MLASIGMLLFGTGGAGNEPSAGLVGVDGQRVRIQRLSEGRYALFLPAGFGEARIFCSMDCVLSVDGVRLPEGGAAGAAAQAGEHSFSLVSRITGRERMSGSLAVYEATGIPTLALETLRGSLEAVQADREKKTTLAARIRTWDAEGARDADTTCTLRGHGNLTWTGGSQKRPYRIDLERSGSLLSMGEQTSWVLLANWFDDSYLHNRLAFATARALGCPYTPEDAFVNLYADGCYLGLYQLAQKVSAEGGTLDRPGTQVACLLEFDYYGRGDEASPGFATDLQYVSVKYPKHLSSGWIGTCRAGVLSAERALAGGGAEAFSLVDRDSFVRQFLLEEVFLEKDVDFSSQFFYQLQGDPRFYAGPAWDFDRLLGDDGNTLEYGGMGTRCLWIAGMTRESDVKSGWYKELYEIPAFREELRRVYAQEFAPVLERLRQEAYPAWEAALAPSAEMDCVRYRRDPEGFSARVAASLSWLSERQDFLEKLWVRGETFLRLTFFTRFVEDNGHDLICLVHPGEPLPALPEGGGILGWELPDGTPVAAGDALWEDAVLYPVLEEP